ncbi:DEAD/DEAH box helicase family protein [Actinoplanes sp. NEAU-A12]|uniref:DEAD/DEAH box helicase family protein n=1 Tax=Actinoplanes sandaracinus TaxID=3045177 RepID=A0ABT6WTK6_9ACTN|nr:DEAD/DEAH box helicase family protein [Actinoplanes sandaracinus]MDI6103083.1 DEAD/DEAH box helicase family protein [Actinoplanes sandaracinus]
MRLQFKVQEFQTEAVAAVVDCFAGRSSSHSRAGNAAIGLDAGRLLENIRAVQRRAGLPLSTCLAAGIPRPDAVPSPGVVPNLDVEMETGTGKTYVYIKTIMELNRRYGWSRFIVVVPGVAIREGVRKTFEITAEHFQQAYGTRPRHFTYDSSALHELERFRSGAGVQVMIINLQAFNTAGRDNRRIYEELDGFSSQRPIDVISASRPIVVIDEPQRIGSARSLESLSRFDPLMVLRYSATHRVRHDLVHRLDALDAYRKKLVKRIAVVGVEGDAGPAKRRLQIREVIRAHLDRERELFARGVKVLSLLFIDQVARYRDYSRPDQLGEYARMFVEEYRAMTAVAEPDESYRRYLAAIPAERTHQGYFAVDRRSGRLIDGSASDVDAYDLILRDRERLLSLDEPVRFVFSHSALREGWDNPNVFVIGMLKRGDGTVSRRQEIGRGLRLAVDQHGERVDDPAVVHEINELTVVTDESYAAFVAGLQRERGADVVVDGRRTRRLPRNDNFRRPEFQEALDRITRRAVYRVAFASGELIERCVVALDEGLVVAPLRYTVRSVSETSRHTLDSDVALDLLGEVAEQTRLTRRTIGAILTGVRPRTFALYRNDPSRFVRRSAEIICRVKAELLVEHVRYETLPSRNRIFTGPGPRIDLDRAGPRLAKHIYDHAATDPAFAQALEARHDVLIHAKLPSEFVIPTPLGDYHPGWLVVLDGRCVVTAHGGDDDPARIACARRWFEALNDPGVTFSVAAPPAAFRPAARSAIA